MKLLVAFLLLGLVGCVAVPSSPNGFRITDFKQGLVDFTSGQKAILTTVGNDFIFRVNGNCVVNGKMRPCMWYGIDFFFESPLASAVLTCSSHFSHPSALVNPTTDFGKVSVSTWSITLKGKKGRYTQPEYMVHTGAEPIWSKETICLFQGKEAFRYTFTIRTGVERQPSSE